MVHKAPRTPLNVELRHLRYFVAVAEELHFGRAAARVYIAQPALSNAIRGLERELGVRLFERTTRSVALTPAGEDLLPSARSLLGAVAEALATTRSIGGGAHPPLVLGVSPDLEPIVGPAVDTFLAEHPGADVELSVCSDASAIEQVRTGKFDGALCWTAGFVGSALERTVLAVHELVAAIPAGHPLAALDQVPVERFAREAPILFPRAVAPGLWDTVVGHLYADGSPPSTGVRDRNRCYDEMVRCACEQGRVTVVSSAFAGRQRGGACVYAPFDKPLLARIELITRVDGSAVLGAFASTGQAVLASPTDVAGAALAA